MLYTAEVLTDGMMAIVSAEVLPSAMAVKISSRGSGELAILTVLAQAHLHGYEIAKRIEQQTAGVLRFNLASLYPMLYGIEKRGWVKGTWEIAFSGRRRRC